MMKKIHPALLIAALAWSCSGDSDDDESGGSTAGAAGTGVAGSSGTGMAGMAGMAGTANMAEAGSAGTGMGEPLSFAADVHPFLVSSCGGTMCHDGNNFLPAHGSEDVDAAYAATQEEVAFPAGVLLHEAMVARTRGDALSPMPPNCSGAPGSDENCLTVEQFELLEAWSEQGAAP